MTNLIVVGATGAVGKQVIGLLDYNYAPFKNLRLLASKSSAGKSIIIKHKEYFVEAINENSFLGFDFAIFCVDTDISKKYVPIAVKSGCRVIDNSSAFRMMPGIPLIVPEINFNTFSENNYIIANPNCCTAILTMALYPLHINNKIKEIQISTYQSASGAGEKGMKELIKQSYDYINGNTLETEVFGRQYLWNVFSHNSAIDLVNGYNGEEIKIMEETKKILNTNLIDISVTCVRVPVLRSHSLSVSLTFTNENNANNIRELLNSFPGVQVVDDRLRNIFPEPILSNHSDNIFVGRIRNRMGDNTNTKFELFICGDQLLKGAALNAIQIYNEICKKLLLTNKEEIVA